MKDFIKELAAFDGVLGFAPQDVQQGSREWHMMRAGVITASRADCLLAAKGTLKRDGYLAELVGQVCTGQVPDDIPAKALMWGREHELAAKGAYSAARLEIVKDIPFIYKDRAMRFGCSPDGLLSDRGLELKCPWSTRTYIEFACSDKIKPEYIKQCQFSMWMSGLDQWDFANFDPRMQSKKLHLVTIERDEKMMKLLDEAGAEFIEDMDAMLNKLGFSFGEQWVGYEQRD